MALRLFSLTRRDPLCPSDIYRQDSLRKFSFESTGQGKEVRGLRLRQANHEGCLECKGRSLNCLYKLSELIWESKPRHPFCSQVCEALLSERRRDVCTFLTIYSRLLWLAGRSWILPQLQCSWRPLPEIVLNMWPPWKPALCFLELVICLMCQKFAPSAFTRPSCAPSTCVELCLCCRDQGAIACLIKCNCTADLSRAKQIESCTI